MDIGLKRAEELDPCHLRMARAGLNLTVRELAVMSDMNKATIVRIEAGLSVRASSLEAIRVALETHGARFFENPGEDGVLVSIVKS